MVAGWRRDGTEPCGGWKKRNSDSPGRDMRTAGGDPHTAPAYHHSAKAVARDDDAGIGYDHSLPDRPAEEAVDADRTPTTDRPTPLLASDIPSLPSLPLTSDWECVVWVAAAADRVVSQYSHHSDAVLLRLLHRSVVDMVVARAIGGSWWHRLWRLPLRLPLPTRDCPRLPGAPTRRGSDCGRRDDWWWSVAGAGAIPPSYGRRCPPEPTKSRSRGDSRNRFRPAFDFKESTPGGRNLPPPIRQ